MAANLCWLPPVIGWLTTKGKKAEIKSCSDV
jgi:hypothetical protein